MKKIVWLLLAFVIQLNSCVEDGDMTDVGIWNIPIERFLYADIENLEFEADGSRETIHVTSIYSWTVSCPSWCTLENADDGKSFTVVVSENNSLAGRSGAVIITDLYDNKFYIGILQKGASQRDPVASDNRPPS